jgi:hypothetical protein
MSTTATTDIIVVERSNTAYKCTKADWDTADGGGGGGGGTATYGINIQVAWGMLTAGYHSSGFHSYGTTGYMYHQQTDAAGTYTLSTSCSTVIVSHRPATKFKVGGTWYEVGNATANSTSNMAGPFNAYYKRRAVSWGFTAAELVTAFGTNSGSITGIAIEMYSAPSTSYNSFPSYTAGIKNVVSGGSATMNNSGTARGSYTQVYAVNPKAWTTTPPAFQELLFGTGGGSTSSLAWS